MKLQVLVATMNQKDFSIVEKMNIPCDVVVANQYDRDEILIRNTESSLQKMIITNTIGVGKNRNIALLAATEDLVLFADDDVVYNDDMVNRVTNAFAEIPQADLILFGMDMVKDGIVYEKRRCKKKKLHVWNSMRYGTYRIVARRDSLINNNINFHQCFGGGCLFGSGEDSLFLKECFDKGLKVFSHDYVLGRCSKDKSTWFTGYDEKYFYDKGVLIRHLFPITAYLMALYFGICFKREVNISILKRLVLIYAGIHNGKRMIPYKN